MASFVCNVEGKGSYFVDKESSGIRACMKVLQYLRIDAKITWKPVKRFITIYGKYIELEGGDETPIQTTKLINGKRIVYCQEHGLNDKTFLYPIPEEIC